MAADKATVKLIAPELSTETDGRLDLFLNLASLSFDSTVWGDKLAMGICLMVAHLVTLANRRGSGGNISSQSVGGVSVSYSNSGQGDDELKTTSYGQMYIKLRKSLVITPLIV